MRRWRNSRRPLKAETGFSFSEVRQLQLPF
jgi:hypothetical protein